MTVAALSMLYLTRLDAGSTYLADILPALLLQGLGLGLIFAPAFAGATAGVRPADAGVASAMVNTSQQVGGAMGTAVLSTLASSATNTYLAANGASPSIVNDAAIHGFTTAFWWAAGIFAFGAVVSALVLRSGVPELAHPGEAALAHS
jgi:hypothetical protein